jgi:hypothetical protein
MQNAMEARKRRKEDVEADRRQAVRKGWNLVQGYGADDAGNLVPEDRAPSQSTSDEARERRESARQVHEEVAALQVEVVDWIDAAMTSWFNFFFAMGRGSAGSRLDEASESLGKAADRLQVLGEQIRGTSGRGYLRNDPILIYADAVDGWSGAFDLIARGARMDRGTLAREGLANLDRASAKAERVVIAQKGNMVAGPLATLSRLKPSQRTPRKAVARAKAPWKRAIIAAGSPFDWTAWPS